MILCKIKNCGKENVGKRLCRKHYMQKNRLGFIRETEFRHGMSKTDFYHHWSAMKDRCLGSGAKNIRYYSGRGIKICERWIDFRNFMDDMLVSYNIHIDKFGRRNTTLERINNKLGYSPKNCRWATYAEQWRNKSNTRLITFDSKTFTLSEWARRIGVNHMTLSYRIKNWELKRAILTPNLNPKK